MKHRKSHTRLNTTCDFCGGKPEEIIDAPTGQGWAHMCPSCARDYASGSGTRHKNGAALPNNRVVSFKDWRGKVERSFMRRCEGLSPDDVLGDWPSRDMYDNGLAVDVAVEELFEKAMSSIPFRFGEES